MAGTCPACAGRGEVDDGFEDCRACQGSGRNLAVHRPIEGPYGPERNCLTCGGSGRSGLPKRRTCSHCGGTGRIDDVATSGGAGGKRGPKPPLPPPPPPPPGPPAATRLRVALFLGAGVAAFVLLDRRGAEPVAALIGAAVAGLVAQALWKLVLGVAALSAAVAAVSLWPEGRPVPPAESAAAVAPAPATWPAPPPAAAPPAPPPAAPPPAQPPPPATPGPGVAHPSAPHVVGGGMPGTWIAAPGYRFVASGAGLVAEDPAADLSVAWTPGDIRPGDERVAGLAEGEWLDPRGYWVRHDGSGRPILFTNGLAGGALAPGTSVRLLEPGDFTLASGGAQDGVTVYHGPEIDLDAIVDVLAYPPEGWAMVRTTDGGLLDLGTRVEASFAAILAEAGRIAFVRTAGPEGEKVVVESRAFDLGQIDGGCGPRALPDGTSTTACIGFADRGP